MFDAKRIDDFLQDRMVRSVAAVGVLLLVTGFVERVLLRLALAFESGLVFDSVWNISYMWITASLVVGVLWVVLSITQNYEQPWWLVVIGVFAAWIFVVLPVAANELPNFLGYMVILAGEVVQVAGVVLAGAILDRAIPRQRPGVAAGGFRAAPASSGGPSAGHHDQQHEDPRYGGRPDNRGQPHEVEQQALGGTAPGWYPDPTGEGTSRWWDGNAWSSSVR
jgi:hypothetical protein